MNYNRTTILFLEVLPMKKFKSFLVTALVCVMTCCCLLFTGCGKTGTYKFESLKYDDGDNSLTAEVGDKFEGLELKKDTFILIIEKETFILRASHAYEDDGEEYTETTVVAGTWVKGYEKEIYFIVEDDDTVVAKKDGNKITFEYEGIELTLKK